MSDRKAELERKKLRLQQIREEKKRKEEEKKKREVQFIFKISSLIKPNWSTFLRFFVCFSTLSISLDVYYKFTV